MLAYVEFLGLKFLHRGQWMAKAWHGMGSLWMTQESEIFDKFTDMRGTNLATADSDEKETKMV